MSRRRLHRGGPRSRRALIWAAGLTAMLLGGALAGRAAAQYRPDSSSWPQNAEGYAATARVSKSEGRPMFVYFRTDWCPYCREFERQLLISTEVDGYMQGLARVRVNPEAGRREGMLADAYGVQGYPGIYWQRHPAQEPVRISRIVRGPNGETRMKTPEEFIAALRVAASK